MIKQTDPTRYSLEDIQVSIEGKYSSRQLNQVLSEFGYDKSRLDNGLDDEGFRKLQDRLAEVDSAEARLKPMKRKDLSSKVVEKPVRVKKKKENPTGYLSVVGKDLGKVGRGVAKVITIPLFFGGESLLTFPSLVRQASEDAGVISHYALETILNLYCNPLVIGTIGGQIWGHWKLCNVNPVLGWSILGARVATNLASGIYEYARHIKKRAREEMNQVNKGKIMDAYIDSIL